MKAAFYAGNSRIELRDVPSPTPGPGDVLIRMRASVICGSELHDYHSEHGGQGDRRTRGRGRSRVRAGHVRPGGGPACRRPGIERLRQLRALPGGRPGALHEDALPRRHARRVHGRARHVLPPRARRHPARHRRAPGRRRHRHALPCAEPAGDQRGRHGGGLRLRADRAGVHRRAALLRRAYPGRRAGRRIAASWRASSARRSRSIPRQRTPWPASAS